MGVKKRRRLKNNQRMREQRGKSKPHRRAKPKPKPKRKTGRGRGGFRRGAGRKPNVPNKTNAELRKILDIEVDFTRLIRGYYRRALHGNRHAFKILMEYRYGKAPQPLVDLNPDRAPLAAVYEIPAFNYGPAVAPAAAAAVVAVPAAAPASKPGA